MRLIDADELLTAFPVDDEPTLTKSCVRMTIQHMPTIEPQRGKWVGVHAYCNHLNEEAKVNGKTERYVPSGMVIGVYCNKCWCIADKKSDFCPYCGADMKGGEDGTT
jgi:hypothetical protein